MPKTEVRMCSCGMRYEWTIYEDSHTDRNKSIHCEICHDKQYSAIYHVCKDCELQVAVLCDEIRLDGKSYIAD